MLENFLAVTCSPNTLLIEENAVSVIHLCPQLRNVFIHRGVLVVVVLLQTYSQHDSQLVVLTLELLLVFIQGLQFFDRYRKFLLLLSYITMLIYTSHDYFQKHCLLTSLVQRGQASYKYAHRERPTNDRKHKYYSEITHSRFDKQQ